MTVATLEPPRKNNGIKINALCLLMPPMSPDEERELDSSILKNGLRHPIVLWRGEIIDGRSRQASCDRTGVEPRYVKWRPMAVTEREISVELSIFIMVENLHRRHGLTQSQKAIVAGALLMEVQKAGRRAKPAENADGSIVTQVTIGLTQGQAADAAGVSRKVMNEAAQVLRKSPPPIQEAVRLGVDVTRQGHKHHDFISAGDAANILDLKPAQQLACLQAVIDGKARRLTSARANLFEVNNRTGMSKKTRMYEGVWKLDELAESPDLYEESIRLRNEGGTLISIALAGDSQRPVERCQRPGCGKLLFETDARIKNESGSGWKCRECPGGRSGSR